MITGLTMGSEHTAIKILCGIKCTHISKALIMIASIYNMASTKHKVINYCGQKYPM